MQISIKTDFPEVQRKLDRIGRQASFASAVALTRIAQDVRADLRLEMRRSLDRPTPYTMNSLFLDRATKTHLQATVFFKNDFGTRQHYLMPQIEGGSRRMKRFEERLVKLGVMRPNERAVPGAGVPLDSYGNISRGTIVKILSQLGSVGFSGDFSVKTNSRRSKAKRAREGYFASAGPGGNVSIVGGEMRKTNGRTHQLPRGVWLRRNFGPLGSAVRPVLLFVTRANYRKRFKFFDVARATIARTFAGHFEREIANAIRTAR